MGAPRNHGGSAAISNLQAFCFRGMQASYGHREADCVFCALEGCGRVLLKNELALCIADAYPVSEGHSLVIPRRHGADGLELHQPEWNAVVEQAACPGRHDQRLGWFAQRMRGAELKRGGGADVVSCALASDSTAGGGLRAAAGWGAGGNC
ncbi:hypothetical protein KBZ01_05595 [Synechococcus sp. Edmonson 11F2]|nr:hypothetical protein [Synechococcus sp. Edmonson 11F2]